MHLALLSPAFGTRVQPAAEPHSLQQSLIYADDSHAI